jgi:3-methylcrotonyl-CoA carboxylase alpha subunit
MAEGPVLTRIARGTFLVSVGDTRETVYVAGPPSNRWAFWNGHVFQSQVDADAEAPRQPGVRGHLPQTLTAPMPATVLKVLAVPGAPVKKGEAVIVLEAMKMEWPIRALADGVVKTVHCRDGEMVQADQPLVEME